MKSKIVMLSLIAVWLVVGGTATPPGLAAEKLFLGDRHKAAGIACAGCHQEAPPKQKVSMATCLRCHGDYSKVAARTVRMKPNPHDSHLGEVACETCHRAHTASVNACAKCHQMDFDVP